MSSMKPVPEAKKVGDCCSSLPAVCWRTTCLQCQEGITGLWNGSDLRVDPFLLRPGTKQWPFLLVTQSTPQPLFKELQLVMLSILPYNEVSLHYQIKAFILIMSVLLWFLIFYCIDLALVVGLNFFFFYFQNLVLILLNYLDVDKGMYQWDSSNE